VLVLVPQPVLVRVLVLVLVLALVLVTIGKTVRVSVPFHSLSVTSRNATIRPPVMMGNQEGEMATSIE
jgi:hypothetical protein